MAETTRKPACLRWRSLPVRRTLARLALALAILTAAGAGLAVWTMLARPAPDPTFSRLVKIRSAAIKAQIGQIFGGYILVIGDSHVERLFLPSLCGVPVVNAGLSGAGAADLTNLAATLAEVRHPSAIVASFGTNNLLAAEGRPAASTHFAGQAVDLVQKLSALSTDVLVTDLPPMKPMYSLVSAETIHDYDRALEAVCAAAGCRFVRLFEAAGDRSAAAVALEPDGVHLTNYRQVYAGAQADLCPPRSELRNRRRGL
ncbi:SGNH/GDSL hydrolase family protein [Chelatococcus reniformis]|uniref:SGNH hydrolase-type esterase domain-containing protein n=1 Tax=Chelatococcus reniformis TaxID=1494448 RepID=A0A916U5H5_9HYPH|nr:SGNH/GDSL hydrolase family protein [Chelatococcus reniformis]GGC59806.1 hypothetical protein GCM10010994_18160 [Chelatococcus reniformis]